MENLKENPWKIAHRWEYNIKEDHQEIWWEHMNWIQLAQSMNQSWVLVNMVMNRPIPYFL
jgi:hypothetical protein